MASEQMDRRAAHAGEVPEDRRKRFRVKAATPPTEGERAKPRKKAGDQPKAAAKTRKAPAKKAAAKKTAATKPAAKNAAN